MLSRTTWLTPNETEAQILLGRVSLDPPAAAEKLLAMGVRNVALKLGSQGVFLAGRDCPAQQIPAFPVKVVDIFGNDTMTIVEVSLDDATDKRSPRKGAR